jgi:hypothetical protein
MDSSMKKHEEEDDLNHNLELIAIHKRSLRVLELQAAKFGIHIPPYIQIEIEEIRATISSLENKVNELTLNIEQLRIIDSRQEDLANKIHELSREIELSYVTKLIQQKKDELGRLQLERTELENWKNRNLPFDPKLGFALSPVLIPIVGPFLFVYQSARTLNAWMIAKKQVEKQIIEHDILISHLEEEIKKLESDLEAANQK